MADKKLISSLQLNDDCDDEDVSSAILALITSAVHDPVPPKNLSEIHHIITSFGASSHLDPLNTLPVLLLSNEPAARDIISVISECGSAKEVVMAVQEAVERLEHSLENDGEDESDAHGKGDLQEPSNKQLPPSPLDQLILLIEIYAAAIPRIKLRRKTASDTLKPLFNELGKVIGSGTTRATRTQGLEILSNVSTLARNAGKWAAEVSSEDQTEVNAFKLWEQAIIKNLLDRTLLACERFIQSNIAQRTLEECFPRHALRSRLSKDWSEGAESMSHILETYTTLGLFTSTISSTPSDLILSAYQTSKAIDSQKVLSPLLPIIISSIQSNTFLDESLALLIRVLHSRMTNKVLGDLSDDITIPLSSVLPSIASAHPDPTIRHQAFRVLSLVLSSSDVHLRFQSLVALTRDSEFPQMRAAAVGLVKESLLNALSQPRGNNPFLGSMFLRTFGPILFRPSPPDLLMGTLSLKDFQETHEPGRLVECLSLYYVLLNRDTENLTGIKDKDVKKSIDHNLLTPLRRHLDEWMEDAPNNLHDITPIVSLQISLERIEATLSRGE